MRMKCIEFKVNKLVYIDQSGPQHDITPNSFFLRVLDEAFKPKS